MAGFECSVCIGGKGGSLGARLRCWTLRAVLHAGVLHWAHGSGELGGLAVFCVYRVRVLLLLVLVSRAGDARA
jgi:hypothetical protein